MIKLFFYKYLVNNYVFLFFYQLEIDNEYGYFTSMLNVGKFQTDFTFSLLRQPVNKSNWVFHSDLAVVNSFNILEENSIGEYNLN